MQWKEIVLQAHVMPVEVYLGLSKCGNPLQWRVKTIADKHVKWKCQATGEDAVPKVTPLFIEFWRS